MPAPPAAARREVRRKSRRVSGGIPSMVAGPRGDGKMGIPIDGIRTRARIGGSALREDAPPLALRIERDMNETSGNRPVSRKGAMVATTLALWGALVLLFAAPLAVRDPGAWRQAISFGASFWALWLLFLPAVAWLSFRFPIERTKLFRNLGLHLLACLLIVGINKGAFYDIARIFPRPQRSEAPGRAPGSKIPRLPAPGASAALLGLRAALDVLVYWSLVGVCQGIRNFRISQ